MLVDIDGTRRKAWLFLMRLMYSGRDFAWIYERQDQISFLDGHVRAFAHFGGVPAWVADATLDGTRKAYLAALAAVPLLIIDGLGMRKLPDTAAEDPLEIIMRRYERAATLLTSNRPVDDWRKLLGIWTSMDMDSRLGSRTFPAPNDYTDQPGAILVSARSAVEFRFL